MLNSLRDGQINYGTANCPSVHVPPHNVVAPMHQNSLIPTEPTTPVVYPWNSNPRLDHLYGFHSRYYNLDFPTPYPPATNQYVPTSMYRQTVPQCCQPCCRLRSQNIPKTSPPQVLYNPIRPVQQLNRSYKSKKTLKTPCSEQFLPYIPNDLPVKYDTQNCYQQKYSTPYLNSTNYCPPTNNLWIPSAANSNWPTERLRPMGTHDFTRDKNYQRLPNYQSNPYANTGASHHRPYNYAPPVPDVSNYQSPVYHNQLKTNTSEYVSHEQRSRAFSSQSNQCPSSIPQYYNTQSVSYPDLQKPNEPFKTQTTPQNASKSNLNVRDFLENWDEGEEETSEKSAETTAPIVILDCMTIEGDALTKVQEKLNVVSYENLEKVLKENQNPFINPESNEIDAIHNKAKTMAKPNFEPLDYTKRETGIIKPFITEKKTLPETISQSEKSYSVNFDGMVAWYGKKNTDISSTDLIERLADRIFNLSKSQENEGGVSFGTAAYTGQITQTNRSIENPVKDPSKYIQSQPMYNLQHQTEKCLESPVTNKMDCNNDSISRMSCCDLNENNKALNIKSNNINMSCIVENTTKRCLDLSNNSEGTASWNLDQGSQEQHLNMSLYDHSVITKPLDFSTLTDETKGNPFAFEKNMSSGDKSNDNINDQFNKAINENNGYNSSVPLNHHSIHQMDSSNRHFPVIVSPQLHKQEFNGFHESVIQRTGCDKNKHDKISTQTDFESINWNISNDLDKIMKNTNMSIESPFLYDRNNYNILDSISSDKNVSTQWKSSVPCKDLTVNSKPNSNHDTFFDGWNFIESYENQCSKKLTNLSSNNNDVHNSLFSNQMTCLDESSNKSNNISKKIENQTLVTLKDVTYSKPSDLTSNSTRPRDVFNLNNRIPDFGDGFELTSTNELHEYMQFKKSSNDNEHRTDGSIFEHLSEPKCSRTMNETIHVKNDHNKPDVVGLPSFKEKEPLAPVPVPPKLNIVKPIIRDPSQINTVIKQKLKYDNACVDNDNMMSNKTGHYLRDNQTSTFNEVEMKPKYNSEQLNQFDVWSEKFVLKGNSNNLTSSVIQCDVEITQFKSTPENRNTMMPKPNLNNHYQVKNMKLPENSNCNLTENKINVIESDKINSNDFLNCLENTKTDDQKYRDTLDEFETSFGFDIHCNTESNKSFHEDIIDKCLEERINHQIGEHNINTSHSASMSNNDTGSSNNTALPFQCDFQSGYLIKNYFDENKNKTVCLDQKQTINNKEPSAVDYYHSEIEHTFKLPSDKNMHTAQDSEKNTGFNILNDVNRPIKQTNNSSENNDSNFVNQTELKLSFESNNENVDINIISQAEKNSFGYLTLENRSYEFESNNKRNLQTMNSNKVIGSDDHVKANDVCKIDYSSSSNAQELSNVQKHLTNVNVNYELNINNSDIFETKSNASLKSTAATDENVDLKNTENGFGSTFQSKISESIENHVNNKNILELENNNSDLYQTQNLEKIPDFDFEIKCSNCNVQEPTNTKETTLTKNNQTNIECVYEINSNENKERRSTLTISEKHLIEKTSDLNCIDNSEYHDVVTEIKNNIDGVIEVDCDTSNISQEKYNNGSDVDVQNEYAKEINLSNSSTRDCSSTSIDVEVENIFENLYENLKNLNTEKEDSPTHFESNSQIINKCDVFKSSENTKDQNIKVQNTDIVKEKEEETQIDECLNDSNKIYKDNDNVFFEEFVNISESQSEAVGLQKNQIDRDHSCDELTSEKYSIITSDKHTLNKSINGLNSPNKATVCENDTFEKQQIEDIKLGKIESFNQNITQNVINLTVNAVQDNPVEKQYENIKSDLCNTELITDTTYDKKLENNLSNPLEITTQKHYDAIVEIENSTVSTSNPPNELASQPNSNEVVDFESTVNSSSPNQGKSINQQYSNSILEIKDLTRSASRLLEPVESTNQQYLNGIVDVGETIYSKCSSLNSSILTCNELSNTTVDVEDTINSKHSLLTHVENSSNEITKVKDSNSFNNPSLLNTNESLCHQRVNKSNDLDASDVESNSSKCVEPINEQHIDDIVVSKDVSSTKYISLNIDELTCHQNSNEISDIGNLKSSFNIPKSVNEPHSIKTVEIEVSTDSNTSLIKDVQSACQDNFTGITQDSSNLKISEETILKTNENILTNSIDIKSNTNELKLPRIKFILKCHNKSLIKSNIFDQEPIALYKKPDVTSNEKLIAGNIFKKRNKFYKPWLSVSQKQSTGEPDENTSEAPKTIVQQTSDNIPSSSLHNNLLNVECLLSFDNKDRENNEVAPLDELNVLDEKQPQQQYDKQPNSFENEELLDKDAYDSNTVDDEDDVSFVDEEHTTPVPSPFDDFESCKSTPEYYDDEEEYWDKSLENKYKHVLYKTISKLTPKTRVNIRDKFNMRLLARRVVAAKRKRLQRPQGIAEETKKRVDGAEVEACKLPAVVDEFSTGLPTTVLRWNPTKPTKPRFKIKVQLPWGRIFNLKNSQPENLHNPKSKDLKLELGPAKVEVRLSRTPGEWQVAACCPSSAAGRKPKSAVMNVRRLVLQRATSPAAIANDDQDQSFSSGGCSNSFNAGNISGCVGVGSNCQQRVRSSRKLPKIVIRRNGQDNYTSYVSTSSVGGMERGDDNESSGDDETPRLMVRLVRDRKLDAMAADGITTLHLKHLVPITESAAEEDTHGAKRVRYT